MDNCQSCREKEAALNEIINLPVSNWDDDCTSSILYKKARRIAFSAIPDALPAPAKPEEKKTAPVSLCDKCHDKKKVWNYESQDSVRLIDCPKCAPAPAKEPYKPSDLSATVSNAGNPPAKPCRRSETGWCWEHDAMCDPKPSDANEHCDIDPDKCRLRAYHTGECVPPAPAKEPCDLCEDGKVFDGEAWEQDKRCPACRRPEETK